MAAYISVPRDLTKVKSKVAFNLTKRQLVCFGTAALIGVPLFFVLRDSGGNTAATLGMMAVMLPAFFLGMYEKKRSAHGKAAVVLCAVPVCPPENSPLQDQQLLCDFDEGRHDL